MTALHRNVGRKIGRDCWYRFRKCDSKCVTYAKKLIAGSLVYQPEPKHSWKCKVNCRKQYDEVCCGVHVDCSESWTWLVSDLRTTLTAISSATSAIHCQLIAEFVSTVLSILVIARSPAAELVAQQFRQWVARSRFRLPVRLQLRNNSWQVVHTLVSLSGWEGNRRPGLAVAISYAFQRRTDSTPRRGRWSARPRSCVECDVLYLWALPSVHLLYAIQHSSFMIVDDDGDDDDIYQ